MENKNYCQSCSHYAVCAIKENCKKLIEKMDYESRLLENNEFDIKVNCKHKTTIGMTLTR